MKKLFISALFALAIVSSAFASPNSINAKANTNFAASFTKAKNVSWNTYDLFEKVSFQQDNEMVNAFYSKDGEMIGVTKTIALDKLPKAALKTITTEYTFPTYQLKDCLVFTDADNETAYYVSFDKGNENIVLKITEGGFMRVMAKTKK
jgi:hypothetical protein